MKTLFELCIPRGDVLAGNIKESDFAADELLAHAQGRALLGDTGYESRPPDIAAAEFVRFARHAGAATA